MAQITPGFAILWVDLDNILEVFLSFWKLLLCSQDVRYCGQRLYRPLIVSQRLLIREQRAFEISCNVVEIA